LGERETGWVGRGGWGRDATIFSKETTCKEGASNKLIRGLSIFFEEKNGSTRKEQEERRGKARIESLPPMNTIE
jgi:hypothetical protein